MEGCRNNATSGNKKTVLHDIDDILKIHLDVTDASSITHAIHEVLQAFGHIDVIVNNAGYATVGALEDANDEQIRQEYETNLFGLISVIQKILPHFRERTSGMIINVASVAGHMGFPFYSLYNSSKWAVEGLSEALQYELLPFNIGVKVIEPGPIKTDFYGRSMDHTDAASSPYAHDFAKVDSRMNDTSLRMGFHPQKVARKIYAAANDSGRKLRYPVGTMGMLFFRRILPDRLFFKIVRAVMST